MTLTASVGTAQASDGREAAILATHQALDRLGSANVSLGMVFASYEFPIHAVLGGVASLLSNTPLWGISTTKPIDQNGAHSRSVVVALISGSEIKAQASWWPTFSPIGPVETQRLFPIQQTGTLSQRTVLIATDGFSNEADQLYAALSKLRFPVVGCLASAPSLSNKSYQIAGNQSGSTGMAAMFLTGNFRMSSGIAHGWVSSGHHFKINSVKNNLIRSLDSDTPAKAYSKILGHTQAEWVIPPLAELVRLYPLGIEQEKKPGLLIRSPIRVNPDGSFLMNSIVKEGSTGFLMIGTRPACLKSASEAVQEALTGLNGAKPLLVLVFCDVAWQLLFEAQNSPEFEAIRSAVGNEAVVAGGYTLGQIEGNFPSPPEIYNQTLQIVMLSA